MGRMNDEVGFEQYHQYLLGRSNLGYLYRRFVLYPALSRRLKGRTLDIGCGIGDMLLFRPDTIGVDVNPMNVRYCADAGLPAHLMEPDILPFEEKEFDSAILDNVLEHIADPGPLLKQTARVLRPGGVLICGVPGRKGYASDPDHKIFYSDVTLSDLLEDFGFELTETLYMPLKGKWFEAIIRQYCVYCIARLRR